jgi:hypothetical protein
MVIWLFLGGVVVHFPMKYQEETKFFNLLPKEFEKEEKRMRGRERREKKQTMTEMILSISFSYTKYLDIGQ